MRLQSNPCDSIDSRLRDDDTWKRRLDEAHITAARRGRVGRYEARAARSCDDGRGENAALQRICVTALPLAFALIACTDSDDRETVSSPTPSSPSTPTSSSSPTAPTSPFRSSSTPLSSALTRYRLDFDRLGPITVGMTREQAEQAGGVSLREGPSHGQRVQPVLRFRRRGCRASRHPRPKSAIITGSQPVGDSRRPWCRGATRDDILDAYGQERVDERVNRFQIREIAVAGTVR